MTQTANERQVGGDHYKKREYQHWDWVTDINLPYLLGVATKYIARWREKNGVEDLEKSLHYVHKAAERNVYHGWREKDVVLNHKFFRQFPPQEAETMARIVWGDYLSAQTRVEALIAEVKKNPAPDTSTP